MTSSHSVASSVDAVQSKSELAGTIRGLRKRVGLTQRQTAQIADCSLASVANLEAGLVPSRSAVAERILAVLAEELASQEGRDAT